MTELNIFKHVYYIKMRNFKFKVKQNKKNFFCYDVFFCLLTLMY